MTDEKWIAPLAKVAREESAPMDPRLDRLVEGTIGEADLRSLEADAERDPQLRMALEAFRPLDSGAKNRIADRVLAARSAGENARPERPPAQVVSLASRRRPVLIGGLVAAAAVLIALVLQPRSIDTLPSYELELTGGVQGMRSNEPAAELEIDPATKIEAVLRPSKALTPETKIETRAYAVIGGERRTIDVQPQMSSDGAARWELRGAQIAPNAAGEGWLIFLVATPDRMADAERLTSGAPQASTSGDGFRVLSRRAIFRKTMQ